MISSINHQPRIPWLCSQRVANAHDAYDAYEAYDAYDAEHPMNHEPDDEWGIHINW